MDSNLNKIRQDMEGQDNRATAHPIYVVQQKKRIYGFNLEDADGFVWLNEEGEIVAEGDGGDCRRFGYIDIWEFVQPFFSAKGADAYIAANRHNLTKPRVYVESAYRNKEWRAVRAELLGSDRDD